MPKKTRKAKIRASQRPVGVGPVVAPVGPTPLPVGPREPGPRMVNPAAPVATARVAGPMPTDYGYVYRDLRRIGLLALLFFGLMFVLWFIVEVQGIHLIPGIL